MRAKRASSLRHWELAEILEKDIKNGLYPVGGQLPTEEKLCELFEASRHSVREALGYLSNIGLITRKPRAGSLVIATSTTPQLVQSVGSIQQLLNYPGETSRVIISTKYVTADHQLANLLKCAPGESWFHIQSLRYPKGSSMPICLTDIYILPLYAGVIKHKKHELIPVADQIFEMYGESSDTTQIDIVATVLSLSEASQLKVKKGSPALTVTRRYTNKNGKVFGVGNSVHPAERYTYSFYFKRDELSKTSHK
jgi:DNA-binding GntR family transcriptional regulator